MIFQGFARPCQLCLCLSQYGQRCSIFSILRFQPSHGVSHLHAFSSSVVIPDDPLLEFVDLTYEYVAIFVNSGLQLFQLKTIQMSPTLRFHQLEAEVMFHFLELTTCSFQPLDSLAVAMNNLKVSPASKAGSYPQLAFLRSKELEGRPEVERWQR